MPRNVRVELSRAVELHRTGRLDEAIGHYRRAAKAQPGSFAIRRLLALALLQAGRAKDALSVARRARDDHPADPHAHLVMGMALRACAETEPALSAFNTAAALDPALSEADYLAANALGALGRLEEAVARYDLVIARDPRAVEARSGRAEALSLLGREREALADLESLTAMQPWQASHFIAKAGALAGLDAHAPAAEAAAEAVRLAPEAADAHKVHAQALLGLGRLAAAREALEAAARLAPTDLDIAQHLIALLRLTGDFPAALAQSERVLAGHPGAAAFLHHRAEARRALDDAEGARADAEAALQAEAGFAPAAVTLARALADLGEAEQVRPALERALAGETPSPDALYLIACEDLAAGRWPEGWAGYEHRARTLPAPFAAPDVPRWDGSDVPGTLVVLGEQDAGAQILFSRLLRPLADRGHRVVLVTRPDLMELLRTVDARVEMASAVPALGEGDRWVPLGSLPSLLADDPADWPTAPYLRASPERIARWARLREPGQLMVGVSWQSDAGAEAAGRSAPLGALKPLAQVSGLRLVSLYPGAGASVAGLPLVLPERGPNPADAFPDTIAMLQHLDLVVTTDGALAHLAGARGIPTFLAARAVPDWCWGRQGRGTPFYDGVRVFRQERAGDWTGVFRAIAAELSARAAAMAA